MSPYWLLVVSASAVSVAVEGTSLFSNQTRKEVYDVSHLVAELGLQFCTIVEIGQGFCSMFLEVREAADSDLLKQGSFAEVFLGECQCSSLREWSLCNPHLVEARGETCRFKEATGRDPTSQRVHRRLCDFDHIITAKNRPCDCMKRLDDSPSYPVEGLGTCFRTPLPESVCGRHSVCGVYPCQAVFIEGFTLVQCDKNCKGKQPFCEDPTEKAPTVTSYWSEWTPAEQICFDLAKASEASCLAANTRAPAFDCLGPGPYCCPPEDDDCFCDVEYTPTGKKVIRFTNVDSHINLVRSVAKRTNDRTMWRRLLTIVTRQHDPNNIMEEKRTRTGQDDALIFSNAAVPSINDISVQSEPSLT